MNCLHVGLSQLITFLVPGLVSTERGSESPMSLRLAVFLHKLLMLNMLFMLMWI